MSIHERLVKTSIWRKRRKLTWSTRQLLEFTFEHSTALSTRRLFYHFITSAGDLPSLKVSTHEACQRSPYSKGRTS